MHNRLDEELSLLGIQPIEWQRIKRVDGRNISHDTQTENFSAWEWFKSKEFVLGQWLK